MSTSVYKSEALRTGYRFATRRNRNAFEKVKRLLFGPVDHEDNKNFLENQLSIEYTRGCDKWNFDFREETTLNPDGDYIWAPPSPIHINRKRKPVELVDDSSAFYFQPIEVSGGPSLLLRPIEPVARSPEKPSKTALRMPKQSLITDYMAKSKRPVVCSKDTSDERPKKIPKLSDIRSS